MQTPTRLRARSALVVLTVAALFGGALTVATTDAATATTAQPTANVPTKATLTASTTLATLKIQIPKVTIKAQGKSKYVAAKDGQVLHEGDAIQTDVGGRAEINYTDGSLTRLSPSTSFKITKLTSKRGGRQTQGTLGVGETWNRAAKVSESGSFEVKSGSTTAAVEGTAFVFSCVKQGKHKICTVIGVVDTVRVTTPGGGIAELGPGKIVLVTDDVPGSVGTLTYEEMIKLPVIVDNLALDQLVAKGGLFEITPPAPPVPPTPDPPADTPGPVIPPDNPPEPPPDFTLPTITLSTPPDGATYARDQVVNASYSCADEDGGSGLATCVASVPSGSPIDTSIVGPHSFTAAASDNAGNTAFVTHNYTVTDVTAPVITLTTPAANATFTRNQAVNASVLLRRRARRLRHRHLRRHRRQRHRHRHLDLGPHSLHRRRHRQRRQPSIGDPQLHRHRRHRTRHHAHHTRRERHVHPQPGRQRQLFVRGRARRLRHRHLRRHRRLRHRHRHLDHRPTLVHRRRAPTTPATPAR